MHRHGLVVTGLLVREGRFFSALCPELDVASQGETALEAKRMLRAAVVGYLEACFESNLPCLRPVPAGDDPRRTTPDAIVSSFRMNIDLAVRIHA